MRPVATTFGVEEKVQETSNMGVPHITSFCWCLGLESGTKLIGYLHLLVSFTLIVLSSVMAESMRPLVGTVEDAEDHLYSSWYKIATSVAVISVIHFLLAITLIYGVHKRNVTALRVWVWLMIVLYFASLAYVVFSMTFGFTATGSHIFLAFLEGILFFGILAYCILCVNSYYLMLKSAEDMETPYKTDY